MFFPPVVVSAEHRVSEVHCVLLPRERCLEESNDQDFTSDIDEPQVSKRWFCSGSRNDGDRHPTLKTRKVWQRMGEMNST